MLNAEFLLKKTLRLFLYSTTLQQHQQREKAIYLVGSARASFPWVLNASQ